MLSNREQRDATDKFWMLFPGGFIKHKEFRVNLEETPHSYLQEVCLCTPLAKSEQADKSEPSSKRTEKQPGLQTRGAIFIKCFFEIWIYPKSQIKYFSEIGIRIRKVKNEVFKGKWFWIDFWLKMNQSSFLICPLKVCPKHMHRGEVKRDHFMYW